MQKIFKIFIIFINILFLFVPASRAAELNIAATQPWLAVVTSFIGGSNANVISLSDFNGKFTASKADVIEKIIALDHGDIKRFNINNINNNIEIWYLYNSFPLQGTAENYNSSIEAAIFDPSVTPFIAQKILTALSTWDATNYPYYQHRLAEFQTRLSSSVLAGKQLLSGTKVYIEGEDFYNLYNLLTAAGCNILKNNKNGTEGAIIIVDGDASSRARRGVRNAKNIFYFNRPVIKNNNYNIDYPAFLHNLYIALWQLKSGLK